jgi:hypothetical protein
MALNSEDAIRQSQGFQGEEANPLIQEEAVKAPQKQKSNLKKPVAEGPPPQTSVQKAKGILLFAVTIVFMQISNQFVKTNQQVSHATGAEINYWMYICLFPLFFLNMKLTRKDPLNVPPSLRGVLLLRVLTGCLMDIMLSIAF